MQGKASTAQFTANILRRRSIAANIYEMWLSPHPAMAAARPGQFVQVAVGSGYDPFLRRPLSICQVNAAGEWSLIYRVQGQGTAYLSNLPPGAAVDVLGPLGNGFSLPASMASAPLLVGGGVGVPPLLFLAQRLCERGYTPQILLGFASKAAVICLDEFAALGLRPAVASDDGSYGRHGLVSALFPPAPAAETSVYACGPLPMLKSVAEWAAAHHLPCQVSLEARMACGVGACLGCVCRVRHGAAPGWERICREGPVFSGAEVVWDEQ